MHDVTLVGAPQSPATPKHIIVNDSSSQKSANGTIAQFKSVT
jgi:hypothetical protein